MEAPRGEGQRGIRFSVEIKFSGPDLRALELWDKEATLALGVVVAKRVVERVRVERLDARGQPFPFYSPRSKKAGQRINLTDTRKMLDTFKPRNTVKYRTLIGSSVEKKYARDVNNRYPFAGVDPVTDQAMVEEMGRQIDRLLKKPTNGPAFGGGTRSTSPAFGD